MAGVDTIGKGTYITNQNYSGVKIDIHNPVVNVPQQNEMQPQAQPLKIYKYQEAQIPPEYFPQMIKGQKKLPKTTTTPPGFHHHLQTLLAAQSWRAALIFTSARLILPETPIIPQIQSPRPAHFLLFSPLGL